MIAQPAPRSSWDTDQKSVCAAVKKTIPVQANGIAQYFKRFPGCEAAKRSFTAPRMASVPVAATNDGSQPSDSDANSEAPDTPRSDKV